MPQNATLTETTDPDLKAKLPPGPWQDEPDKVQWYDATTDMACLIVRGHHGALCGYVGVEPSHPWHGDDYADLDVEVHGGLTYANACQEDGKICHIPAPGREHNVWWFGFDCVHAYDWAPLHSHRSKHDTYRDIAYVRSQVANLAAQLAAVTA